MLWSWDVAESTEWFTVEGQAGGASLRESRAGCMTMNQNFAERRRGRAFQVAGTAGPHVQRLEAAGTMGGPHVVTCVDHDITQMSREKRRDSEAVDGAGRWGGSRDTVVRAPSAKVWWWGDRSIRNIGLKRVSCMEQGETRAGRPANERWTGNREQTNKCWGRVHRPWLLGFSFPGVHTQVCVSACVCVRVCLSSACLCDLTCKQVVSLQSLFFPF